MLKEQINEFLNKYPSWLSQLKEINHELPPMSETCVGSIVIPAHNEEATISDLLRTLADFDFDDEFEVLIVNNNSTDHTEQETKDFLSKNSPDKVKIHVVTKDFEPDVAGVGIARKFGIELSLLRVLARRVAPTEFYFLWLDADNSEFSEDFFNKVIPAFKQTGAVALAGRIKFDWESASMPDLPGWKDLPKLVKMGKILRDEVGLDDRYFDSVRIHAPGANTAHTAGIYLEIGGLVPDKTSEDTKFGKMIQEAGYKLERLETTVFINPRRLYIDPLGWYDSSAWKEERFYALTEVTRSKSSKPVPIDGGKMSAIVKNKLDLLSRLVSEKDNRNLDEVSAEMDKRAKEICVELGVSKEFMQW